MSTSSKRPFVAFTSFRMPIGLGPVASGTTSKDRMSNSFWNVLLTQASVAASFEPRAVLVRKTVLPTEGSDRGSLSCCSCSSLMPMTGG